MVRWSGFWLPFRDLAAALLLLLGGFLLSWFLAWVRRPSAAFPTRVYFDYWFMWDEREAIGLVDRVPARSFVILSGPLTPSLQGSKFFSYHLLLDS